MIKAVDFLLEKLSFPETAFLGSRIPKKQFLENDSIASKDKKLFKENIKSIFWEFTLKSSTCAILPYTDAEREYPEIAVLKVELSGPKNLKRIAEVIHRAIPYPMLIIFWYDQGNFALSIAPKRLSLAEKGAFVAERILTTEWLDVDCLKDFEKEFVDSLAWRNQSLLNFGTFYDSWLDRFISYDCAKISGNFKIASHEDRQKNLARCRDLEIKISECRQELKKSAFNKQVELNTQIKKLENELRQLACSL